MSAATSPHPFEKPTVSPSDHELRPDNDADAAVWDIAARVPDPEIPVISIADLGILRGAQMIDGTAVVTITPTYSGCPAMATMRDDLQRELLLAGFPDAEVRVSLTPAWTSDWITERGKKALKDAGISPPGAAPRNSGPVALTLMPTRRAVTCVLCGSDDVRLSSEFGATACKAMYQCNVCLEPFDHVKEI